MQSSVTHLSGAVDCPCHCCMEIQHQGNLNQGKCPWNAEDFRGISKEQHLKILLQNGGGNSGLNEKKPCQFGERKGKYI